MASYSSPLSPYCGGFSSSSSSLSSSNNNSPVYGLTNTIVFKTDDRAVKLALLDRFNSQNIAQNIGGYNNNSPGNFFSISPMMMMVDGNAAAARKLASSFSGLSFSGPTGFSNHNNNSSNGAFGSASAIIRLESAEIAARVIGEF